MATPVQSTATGLSIANNTTVTSSTAWTSNLTVGNIVVVAIALAGSTNNPSPTVSSVSLGTDALALVTGAAISNGSGNTGSRVEIWAGTVATASQRTLTVNTSATCNIKATGSEYLGTTYTLTLDNAAVTNTGSSTTPTTGSRSTSNAKDLLVAAFAYHVAANPTTPTNSFVIEGATPNGAGAGGGGNATGTVGVALTDRPVTSTGTYSTGVTDTTSVWAAVIVAFQQVTPPGVMPPNDLFRAKNYSQQSKYRALISQRPPNKPLRRYVNKLVRDIQPPAAKLGVPPKIIFETKTKQQQSLYRKLISTLKPFSNLRRNVSGLIKRTFTKPPVPTPPLVYAGSFSSAGQVVAFPTTANGYVQNPGFVTPTAEIVGSNTGWYENGFTGPSFTAIDPSGNLWVGAIISKTSGGPFTYSISKFTAGASGNIAPTVTISGSNTGLSANGSQQLGGLAFDHNGNLWCVADYLHVVMFSAAQLVAGGNITPATIITGANTGFQVAYQVAIGPDNKIYVSDVGSTVPAIHIFAANATGNATPNANISGTNTGLVTPYGIAVDSNSNIYLADIGINRLAIWNAGVTGNVAPSSTITGPSTDINNPVSVALDASNNIYLFHGGVGGIIPTIAVWLAGTTGNVIPNNQIRDRNSDYLAKNLGFLAIWNAAEGFPTFPLLRVLKKLRIFKQLFPSPSKQTKTRFRVGLFSPLELVSFPIKFVHKPRQLARQLVKAPLRRYVMKLLRNIFTAPVQLGGSSTFSLRPIIQRPNMMTRIAQFKAPAAILFRRRIIQRPIHRFIKAVHRFNLHLVDGSPISFILPKKRLRQVAAVKVRAPFRRFSYRLLHLIQPPAFALGIWLRVIKRPRLWKPLNLRGPLRRYAMKLLRNVTIPSGLRLRIVHHPRTWKPLNLRGPLRRYALALKNLIQPPVAKLGIWMRVIHKPRLTPNVLVRKPLRRYAMKLLRNVTIPSGIWLRIVKRSRIWKPKTPAPILRRYTLRLLKLIQPPASALGQWLRVIKHPRIWKAKSLRAPLIIFVKKTLFSPPISSSPPLKIVHRPRQLARQLAKVPLRRYVLKLLRLVQPPASALGIWMRVIHKPRLTLRQPVHAPLRRYVMKLLRLIVPAAAGLPLRIIHRPRQLLRQIVRGPLRRYSLKLLRLIQPPASALGQWLRVIHRPRIILRVLSRPPLRRYVMKLLRLIQPPTSALGMWMRVIKRPRSWKPIPVRKSLRRYAMKLLRNVTIPSGIWLKIAKRPRSWKPKTPAPILRRYVFRLLRLIQPPVAKLGIWMRVIMHPRRWKPIFPKLGPRVSFRKIILAAPPAQAAFSLLIKLVHHPRTWKPLNLRGPLRRYVLRLLSKIQPSSAKLGVPPRLIFEAKTNQAFASYRKLVSTRRPFLNLRRYVMILLRKIQPPVAKLGMWMRVIHRPRIIPRQRILVPLRRFAMKLLRNVTIPSGIWLKIAKRPRSWKPIPVRKPLRRYAMKLLRNVTIPSGIWLRIVKRSRPWKPLRLRGPLRRYAMQLKNLIQPPAAKLGVWLKVIKRQRRLITRLPAALKRTFPIRTLIKSAKPSAANIAVWLRLVKHSRLWKPLPVKPFLRFSFKKLLSASSIPSGLWLRIVKRPRTWKAKAPAPILRRYVLRLLRVIQPSAAALGVPPKIIFFAKTKMQQTVYRVRVSTRAPFKALRVYVMKLLRSIQPPASVLGIWMHVIKRPRKLVTKLPKALPVKRTFVKSFSIIVRITKTVNIILAYLNNLLLTIPLEVSETPPKAATSLNITMALTPKTLNITMSLNGLNEN